MQSFVGLANIFLDYFSFACIIILLVSPKCGWVIKRVHDAYKGYKTEQFKVLVETMRNDIICMLFTYITEIALCVLLLLSILLMNRIYSLYTRLYHNLIVRHWELRQKIKTNVEYYKK